MEQDRQREKEAEKRQFRRVMSIAGVVIFASCCIILFYFCVKRYEGLGEGWDKFIGVWQPIIIGFILAFLMNPFMEFFERQLLPFFLKHSKSQKKAKKTARMLSTIIALLIIVGITALTFVAIIPELYSTIQFLVTNLGDQIDGVLDWANEITRGRYEEAILGAKGSAADQAIDAALDMAKEYIDISSKEGISMIATSVIGVGKFFVDMLIGMIVSVYVLCGKETFKAQTKKIIYGLLKTEHANTLMEINRKASDVFYGFIIGKLIDSLIIGLICYVCMLIFKMPYSMLVSIIIGVTNIIPVFGPYIGAVPTVIIIFLTQPMQGIYFLIFVIILQQIDGNIIGPKILGDSTGLSSFWVVVAIVVGGGLFGLPGMLVGVPTMAMIYYLCGRFTKHLLRKKHLPEETGEYVDLDSIEVSDHTLIPHRGEYHNKKRTHLFQKNKNKEQIVEENKK